LNEDGAFGKSKRPAQLLARKRNLPREVNVANSVQTEEMDDDSHSAVDGFRLDLNIGKSARAEQVANRRSGFTLGERPTDSDLDEVQKRCGHRGAIRRVGERDDLLAIERRRIGRRRLVPDAQLRPGEEQEND